MKKERIKELANNPNYITGIYNYCDRWCERCPFTLKCLNFTICEEQYSDPESRDINNEKFWESVSEMFRISLEMLHEMAKEKGINLDEIDTSDYETKKKQVGSKMEKNVNSILSYDYIKKTDKWFNKSKELFQNKEDEINLKAELGLPEEQISNEILKLNDAIEIIRWYQMQIHVKIKRAIHGKEMEYFEDFGDRDDFPKDYDGSAKVALIGIDRSITMWSRFLEYFPEKEDNLMDILVLLERLRRNVEKEFPDARAFKRPGFDYFPDEKKVN